jgi:hypothetical protein
MKALIKKLAAANFNRAKVRGDTVNHSASYWNGRMVPYQLLILISRSKKLTRAAPLYIAPRLCLMQALAKQPLNYEPPQALS